ncbi:MULTISPECIES: hypothetical protein [unclassified Paenibacillus]|uniref:hypothetical protein n=1 Tax=unclassified Paenibacillus TaxID=185978 RepID=UPI001C106770|nr:MULTISPECIES: hypothetical protein [unclassified Paenibacillus]MBU5440674.1 hypothetical protein [Paenibacillus sp. MSJ-34]CAH0120292.1 hypothetical protein PAE9249_02809 [Paenibacillus sp. CECT 9249]
MEHGLIQDTIATVQRHISPETSIRLETSVNLLPDMAALIRACEADRHRQIHLLGSYLLVRMAMRRHAGLTASDPDLTERILDGDYLLGCYYDWICRAEEFDLLAWLAPVVKKLQIRAVSGKAGEHLLDEAYRTFLMRQAGVLPKPASASAAGKVIAYETA